MTDATNRRLAALLFADVAGYSRLIEADQEDTRRRLDDVRENIINSGLEKRGGRIVKTMGDGLFVEFSSVVDAVEWAIETQHALKAWNKPFKTDTRMDFRMGIHIGDVAIESDGDILDHCVNIGARLEGVAPHGGICVSDDVHRQTAKKVSAKFVDIGEVKLKNISCPEHVYALSFAAEDEYSTAQTETNAALQIAAETMVKRPERCFGRDEPVEVLIAALTSGKDQVLYVLGTGGIGKTTVTKKAGTDARVVARFGHRRWYVELNAVTDAASLESKLIQAIGLNPAQTNFQQAVEHLAQQTPCLLVLDNLETPWEADRHNVEARLRDLAAVPGVSLLSSLRGGAAPDPQWTWEPIHLTPLDDDAAFEVIHVFAPGIAKSDPEMKPLLRELGGIPLAIELIAKQAATETTLREVSCEWQRHGVQFAADRGVPQDRLSSVERSIDLSLHSNRLGHEGKRLFALLGQLPAGMANEDREELLGDDAFKAKQQSMSVGLAYQPSQDRLDLLPPIRDFARRHWQPIESDAVAWRHHYLRLVAQHGRQIGTRSGAEAVARLRAEVANLDAALYAGMRASLRKS
jgi:class 3 adenylate cyclase